MTVAAAATGLCVAATSVAAMAPTSATLGPNGITAGHNITVFHNIDFVAVSGWPVGEQLTVEVLRNDVVIGSETGTALDIEGSGGLEVNHGPVGAPIDGDCWEGHTPDIRPGDTVRVTGESGDIDDVIVDNITFSGPAFEDPVNADVVVRGVALFADGTPIPISALDSAEFRDTSQFRGVPDEVLVDPAVEGGFEMRYHAPYQLERNTAGLNEAQRKASLLTSGGHAIGFGHVDPLPDHAMLVDGIDDVPGPAAGCEGSPSEQRAVTTLTPSAINAANVNTPVTASGLTADGEAVTLTVTDSLGATRTVEATETGTTWTADLGSLADLADGPITVSGAYGPGPIGGVSKALTKDATAPLAPAIAPTGGTFIGSRTVTLNGGGDPVRYTTDGSQPTAGSALYSGPITLTRTATLRAMAIDGAGNVSPTSSASFRRATVAAAPRIGFASAGRIGRPYTAYARWATPSTNGGAAITRYELFAERISNNRVVERRSYLRAASVRSTQLTLTSGVWRFRVRAVNAVGRSKLSSYSNRTASR
jgi:hypothetical protein